MDDAGCRACAVYDESLTSYNFGPAHPMNPVRVDLTVALAAELGVLDRLPTVPAPDATEDDLVDVHHGDGVESIFYDDPRVLTISLHETGQMLFPGTGFPADAGGPEALGSAVNVALPPGTADAGWLRAFHAVVPPLVREFRPEVLVTQHGCDSHTEDPLAHLMLTVDGQRVTYLALHDLAHEVCAGRWLATGG